MVGSRGAVVVIGVGADNGTMGDVGFVAVADEAGFPPCRRAGRDREKCGGAHHSVHPIPILLSQPLCTGCLFYLASKSWPRIVSIYWIGQKFI